VARAVGTATGLTDDLEFKASNWDRFRMSGAYQVSADH
jgi:hypothetical protein